MDQSMNDQIVVVVWLEQVQETYREARKDGPLPKHICGIYKNVLTNDLF